MKEKLHKLIDLIFESDRKVNNKTPKKTIQRRIIWKTRFYRNDPLAAPVQEKMQDGQRITPSWVIQLDRNQIFVFGSNTRGVHDGGASFTAVQYFGAIAGQAEGIQGRSYAIPTDGTTMDELHNAVRRFIVFAKAHPHLTFLVTEIGCGTAGYHPMEIAPMFTDAVSVPNIYLPKQFWKYIIK